MRAFGVYEIVALGPRRFFSAVTGSAVLEGEAAREGSASGVADLGVATVEVALLAAFSSSSSTPKESLPLAAGLRFFLSG